MSKRPLRKYEPIWLQLKATGKVKVACAAEHRARIRKAVYKEKDLDVAYKVQADLEKKSMRLEVTFKGNTVEFRLRNTKLNAEDL